MDAHFQLAVFIFRRDLRLQDNTGLIDALKLSKKVLPCFIFDDCQIKQNDYKSDYALQFMAHTLQELNEELKSKHAQLYCFHGKAPIVISKLKQELPIEAVFVNRDYTPFSRARDSKLAEVCKELKIEFMSYGDYLLHEPEQVAKADGKPYTVYTPFLNKSKMLAVKTPSQNRANNYFTGTVKSANKNILSELLQLNNDHILLHGGRKEGLKLLKQLQNLNNYLVTRDIPSETGTSHLSAHHKFGTISIRESYARVKELYGPHHTLVNELHWRDFFTHIAYHFPHVFKGAFHAKYDQLNWSRSQRKFEAWCTGQTGFPIVDAGMRQLNTTGFMHNRVRMITASFLTKDLHINWRQGEQYFAQKLIDYDPSVNNGNWQWAASTGCDAQPYFRVFNPWLQQKKFDPDCIYIKKWLPELKTVPAKLIHQLGEAHKGPSGYSQPIVSHAEESDKAKTMFRLLKNSN